MHQSILAMGTVERIGREFAIDPDELLYVLRECTAGTIRPFGFADLDAQTEALIKANQDHHWGLTRLPYSVSTDRLQSGYHHVLEVYLQSTKSKSGLARTIKALASTEIFADNALSEIDLDNVEQPRGYLDMPLGVSITSLNLDPGFNRGKTPRQALGATAGLTKLAGIELLCLLALSPEIVKRWKKDWIMRCAPALSGLHIVNPDTGSITVPQIEITSKGKVRLLPVSWDMEVSNSPTVRAIRQN